MLSRSRSLFILFYLFIIVSISALIDEKLLQEIMTMKKQILKKEKELLKQQQKTLTTTTTTGDSRASGENDPFIPLAILYYQVGMKIQDGWLAKNLPGHSITDALECYQKASDYGKDSLMILLPIVVSKGVLLRMMGRGEEAIAAYEQAISHSLYPIDKAAIEHNVGDTLLMMGKVKEALPYFASSLQKIPCKTERYFPYITSLKELNEFTLTEWQEKLQELKKIQKICISEDTNEKDSQGDDNDDDDDHDDDSYEDDVPSIYPKKSLIFQDLTSGMFSTKHSDFYYALHYVYEKVGDLAKSWYYLEKAKHTEKQHRWQKFNPQEAISNFNNTQLVFTKQMMQSFPNVEEYASNIPIFIIGMMRSGSTLLETMLDSHPNIWGMGEDSIFNANLTHLRDNMIRISGSNQRDAPYLLEEMLLEYGDHTVKKMKETAEQLYYVENKQQVHQLKYIVDKMLFNYRNIHPLDTLLSCYRNKFDDVGLEWSLDYRHIVLQYVLYIEYMNHYRQLLPNRVFQIRYESLVYQPEKTLKKILKKLELPYDEKLLFFHESTRRVQTNSQSQVRQKLYTHSIGQWRKYAKYLEPIRREWLKYLPYLKQQKMLPFESIMNWEMKVDFDYSQYAGTAEPSS